MEKGEVGVVVGFIVVEKGWAGIGYFYGTLFTLYIILNVSQWTY
jgi:hypothetical protein